MGVGLAFSRRRPWIGVVHGVTGIVGLGLLVWLVLGPRRGDATGVGSFGVAAAILLAGAACIGPFVRRLPGLVLALHAGAAITGVVLYWAWAALS